MNAYAKVSVWLMDWCARHTTHGGYSIRRAILLIILCFGSLAFGSDKTDPICQCVFAFCIGISISARCPLRPTRRGRVHIISMEMKLCHRHNSRFTDFSCFRSVCYTQKNVPMPPSAALSFRFVVLLTKYLRLANGSVDSADSDSDSIGRTNIEQCDNQSPIRFSICTGWHCHCRECSTVVVT